MWVEFNKENRRYTEYCGEGPYLVLSMRRSFCHNGSVYIIETEEGIKEYFDYRFKVLDSNVNLDDLL